MSDENNEGIVMPAVVSDKPITEEVISPDVSAESSPASEENHDNKSNGVQQRINDLTAKRYQETRRADEAVEALAKYQAQASQAPSSQTVQESIAPVLPDDIYDEDSMRKYHTDSQAYNMQAAQGAAKSQYESQQQESAQQAQNASHAVAIDKYSSNAVRDGVNFDKLLIAEQTLKQNGLGGELANFLLNDTNGAKIVEYLSDNPAEMHEILKLDPVSAGIRIANEVKPKVLSLTPKVSGAPDPIPEVVGGGYVQVDDFSKNYPGAEII
ncbi:MAG: hypothetical protein Unbinned5350contig1004_63 [Prokaryotic dsDNA virus sp.]|nr:MAG: hypothetical protein Unbinned5350contig1004_63 [Prokaryotic dsDNA virus sp.]|tara:strand:+ start:12443 stop:13249 length:807 start_codon:yes stop_codon:yes gene_type:complete